MITLKPGDVVTLGLHTHKIEEKAWIKYPDLGTTHEVDPRYPSSNTHYREIFSNSHGVYDTLTLPKIVDVNNNKDVLKGKVIEVRENMNWGGYMILVELMNHPLRHKNKRYWFLPHLCNML